MEKLVEYTEFLVKSICHDGEMVKVSSYAGEEDITILDIMVSESDMGVVIGKGGKMASSLRTLILAYAYIHKLGKIKINFDSF